MKIKHFSVPPLNNNAYILWDEKTAEAVVIDPSQGGDIIIKFVEKENLIVRMVLNTHYHFDHVFDNPKLKKRFTIPFFMHKADIPYYEKDTMAEQFLKIKMEKVDINVGLKEGDKITFGKQELTVFHTPGHSEGSICFYAQKEATLFSGDTLFKGTYGRVDLPGSDPEKMKKSLARLATFPIATKILPGHGEETILEKEIEWLKEFKK